MPEVIDNDLGLPYTDQELTEAINLLPNQYGRLQALGMFPREAISTSFVEVRIENNKIVLLPATERGGPATPAARDKGKSLIFKVPHIPHVDTLRPSELQDMNTQVGRARGKLTLEMLLLKRLARVRARHDQTLEWMRTAALKGILLDGAGGTLYNFFTEFGVTEKVVFFALATGTTDILSKCAEVNAHIEDNLGGEASTGVRAQVSTEFFNALVAHAKVKELYLNYAQAMAMAQPQTVDGTGGARARVFPFGNILFEEHRGSMTLYGGSATRLIAANSGVAFPTGTSEVFATYDAPPDMIDAANVAPDEAIAVSQERLKHGKGIEIHSESNPLPITRQPALVVRLEAAAS